MVDEALLKAHLSSTLERTSLPGFEARYEGKVRDNYTREGRRYIVVTDRISAFDVILGTVPFKGQVLNRLAAWWFSRTAAVAPNHMLRVVDPNVLECVECEPLPVEFVVRAYITGSTSTSMWTHYAAGARVFCGHALPDGLQKNERLAAPLLTPATKAAAGAHDVSLSREDILARGGISTEDFDRGAALAMRLFELGRATCAERGLILVDTKFELGKTKDGDLVVIDEIFTPDSSRFWVAETYEARSSAGIDPEPIDKEYVRRYYAALGYRGEGPPPPLPPEVRVGAAVRYIDAYERITGEPFVPNTEEPLGRIAANVQARGGSGA